MGQPGRANTRSLVTEYIGNESERGELKHLSSHRKRKRSDSLSSGERNGKRLNFSACTGGLRDLNMGLTMDSRSVWDSAP
jgi:hypothetical protein